MSRLGGWLKGGATAKSSSNGTSNLQESEYLEDAMLCATLIMNDEIEEAEKRLHECDSSFHLLGRGVTRFLKAILGFEQDIMKDASQKLSDAAAMAYADLKKAQKESSGDRTSIYPSGAEYSLCHAQAQLMEAVVGVLNINLVEAMKSFYKLRKAYLTLDGLIAAEARGLKGLTPSSQTSLNSQQSRKAIPGGFDEDDSNPEGSNTSSESEISEKKVIDPLTNRRASSKPKIADDDDSDLEFEDAIEEQSGVQTPAKYLGHMDTQNVDEKLGKLSLNKKSNGKAHTIPAKPINDGAPDSAAFAFTDPIDVFVHSGTYLCYGMLLLIISLVPPAFSKLLSVIGFKGDREKGIGMLWQSTKFENINGAIAGLVLLGYYNNSVGTCDILPSADEEGEDLLGNPTVRCRALLDEMRARYPGSRLWKLEEARMLAGARDLEGAIEMLSLNSDSKLKQVSAITMFEKSLAHMYLHEYEACAESFLICKEMNSWSHCLYYLIAGSCYACLYREHRETDTEAAQKFKAKAKEYIKLAPTVAGKKRFMAKPGPFDIFVIRKVQKWEERSKEWDCDLVDAIGVSPIEEMIYLWNGLKKMKEPTLKKSLETLDWSQTSYPEKHKADLDETALHALLEASVLRTLGKYDEARRILTTKILNHNKPEFTGALTDDWTAPSAHYEMAVLSWHEKDLKPEDHDAKFRDCETWLQKCAGWGAYTLDARIGMKVNTAIDTVERYKDKKPYLNGSAH